MIFELSVAYVEKSKYLVGFAVLKAECVIGLFQSGGKVEDERADSGGVMIVILHRL